jgi:pyruvate/2-oxoglutarate dehydrogenase complex dihydrolipoamide acyltransferase (E2) component
MATAILLPKLGMAMTEGHLSEWTVSDGASVTSGDIIYHLESDKAVNEIEAPVSGTIRLRAAPDNTYAVGTLLAEIE